jgi:hypothetical protein
MMDPAYFAAQQQMFMNNPLMMDPYAFQMPNMYYPMPQMPPMQYDQNMYYGGSQGYGQPYKNFNSKVNHQKYKTQICRHFEAHGSCSLGNKCSFAHGRDELRNINDVRLVLVRVLSQFRMKRTRRASSFRTEVCLVTIRLRFARTS